MTHHEAGVAFAKRFDIRIFSEPEGDMVHFALLAFPHVSKTLCGLRLQYLECRGDVSIEPAADYKICYECQKRIAALFWKIRGAS